MPFTTFSTKLLTKELLTNDVLQLSFSAPTTLTFAAGQYLMLLVERNGEKKWKPYSLLNPPSQQGKLDLCVKLVPGGLASEAFQEAPLGQEFQARAPFGHFTFAEESPNPEHWFLCAGTGVTPFYSMILEYVKKYPQKKFVLLFSVRQKKDLFFFDAFKQLEKQHSNFMYIPTLTQEKWAGEMGRVQTLLPKDLKNKTFYICGVKEFVLDVKDFLLEHGIAKDDLKMERYT
ncbi:MAG: FAD-binding oxidoreductase [Nanoarchaeota archaeon]|nr:FAD-binding oxidoreductase [Nanoarchaeota archaeon]